MGQNTQYSQQQKERLHQLQQDAIQMYVEKIERMQTMKLENDKSGFDQSLIAQNSPVRRKTRQGQDRMSASESIEFHRSSGSIQRDSIESKLDNHDKRKLLPAGTVDLYMQQINQNQRQKSRQSGFKGRDASVSFEGIGSPQQDGDYEDAHQ